MPIAQVENNDGWRLQSLNVSCYSWEKDCPYKGKITFQNKAEEALSFNIPGDKMVALLALISDSVVDSANRLGHRMAASVQHTLKQMAPALEAPPEMIEDQQSKQQQDDISF